MAAVKLVESISATNKDTRVEVEDYEPGGREMTMVSSSLPAEEEGTRPPFSSNYQISRARHPQVDLQVPLLKWC